ncbi:hypothetical protein CU098_010017, partial [Rhizopus stolonifer]
MTSSAALLSGFMVDSCIMVLIVAVYFLCFEEPLLESVVSLLQSTSVSSLAANGSLFINGSFLLLVFFTAVNTSIFGASFAASHSLLSEKNGWFKTLKV